MKRRLKSLLVLSLIFCLLSQNIVVFADKTTEATTEKSTESKSESLPSELEPLKDKIKTIYNAFIASGFSGASAAGIMGNMYGESGFNTEAEEGGGGTGIGLFQWSFDLRSTAQDYFASGEHKNHTHKSLKGYSVCTDPGCQIEFELGRLDENLNVYWAKYYNDDVKDLGVLAQGVKDKKIPASITVTKNSDEFKKLDNVPNATTQFFLDMERAADTKPFWNGIGDRDTSDSRQEAYIKNYTNRNNTAEAIYKWMGGKSGTPSEDAQATEGDKELAENIEQRLVAAGYWSEAQISEYNKLMEGIVDISGTKDDFSSKELGALSDWEQNVQKMNEKGTPLYIVRIITMIVGIIFTIWMILIYIAYWVDRLNNLIDMELLGLLTFNKLRLSDTEETCDFRLSGLGKGEARTVNHRAILEICILGIAFGALIISGYLYLVILTLVQKVIEFLH